MSSEESVWSMIIIIVQSVPTVVHKGKFNLHWGILDPPYQQHDISSSGTERPSYVSQLNGSV